MKKKYLKPVLTMSMVGVLAIGGTLAYLTDVTEDLVNKFTVDDKVDIELDESYDGFTLTPGTIQDKDPAITVVADDSYVFTDVVETIPTAALSVDGVTYAFADYVDYTINPGAKVYIYDETSNTYTETDWKWLKVGETATGTGTYADGGAYTTYTSVYALVDAAEKLLPVSCLDKADAAGTTDADYPILEGDTVAIPETLTQEMLNTLVTVDENDDASTAYSVDLAFKGYAIQIAGLEGETIDDIYTAAKTNALP